MLPQCDRTFTTQIHNTSPHIYQHSIHIQMFIVMLPQSYRTFTTHLHIKVSPAMYADSTSNHIITTLVSLCHHDFTTPCSHMINKSQTVSTTVSTHGNHKVTTCLQHFHYMRKTCSPHAHFNQTLTTRSLRFHHTSKLSPRICTCLPHIHTRPRCIFRRAHHNIHNNNCLAFTAHPNHHHKFSHCQHMSSHTHNA